jgi:hypothetical protein
MDPDLEPLITAIHQAGVAAVLVSTGGGASAAAWLMSIPGASRSVLETLSPYSEDALCQFLGKRPEGFCTAQTAVDLAGAAWQRAQLLQPGQPVAGVACTASLATDRPKRGDHRFFAAAMLETEILTASLVFEKGARTRFAEERIVSRAVVNLFAEAAGLPDRLSVDLRPGESLEQRVLPRAGLLAAFSRGELPAIHADFDGRLNEQSPAPMALLSGSFNPLHDGHRQLLGLASEITGLPGAFELSAANVDKPPLKLAELSRRLRQFHGRGPVWLTRAPTFVEKSRLFPGSVFVIGHDTAARLILPQYYGPELGGMDQAIDELRRHDCRFLVAARAGGDGELLGLEDLAIPPCFAGLLAGIPKSRFRNPQSSTDLRRRTTPASPEIGTGPR